jgi:hypothetical protein
LSMRARAFLHISVGILCSVLAAWMILTILSEYCLIRNPGYNYACRWSVSSGTFEPYQLDRIEF